MSEEITYAIEWWEREQFAMATPACDTCGMALDEYPAAVIRRHPDNPYSGYALCSTCRVTVWYVQQGHNEFFETVAYNVGLEAKQPGVNVGSRTRKP